MPAPINVGSSYQAKSGGLTLGASAASSSIPLDVEGIGFLRGLIVNGAFQYVDSGAIAGTDSGKVLTSDADGNASWQTAGGGSSGASNSGWITIDSSSTVSSDHVVWPATTTHDPTTMCTSAGYKNYTGLCRVYNAPTIGNFYGPGVFNSLQGGGGSYTEFSCQAGNGYWVGSTTAQILCTN